MQVDITIHNELIALSEITPLDVFEIKISSLTILHNEFFKKHPSLSILK